MPIQKTYKKYEHLSSFGVVASIRSNVLLTDSLFQTDDDDASSFFAITAAVENVTVWDIKKAEKVKIFKGDKEEVTALAKSEKSNVLAVGYSDGSIKVWNLKICASEVSLSGHKSAVSCLSFDGNGTKLVSGSADTEIIVWDIVSECGLYRLKGHKGMITSCLFMKTKNILVTSSKDMLVKFWDLDTQHCFLTVVGHRSEIWQIGLINNETRLITGSGDSELRIYKITDEKQDDGSLLNVELFGVILRQSKGRVVSLVSDSEGRYLACHGTDSNVDIYHVLNEEEVKQKIHKKRKKETARLKKLPESKQLTEIKPDVVQEVGDEIVHLQGFRLKEKIRSCDINLNGKGELKVLLMYTNNSCGCYRIYLEESPLQCNLWSMLQHMGHRTDVRATGISSDASLILSGSGETVKIWNRNTLKCIRTMESDYCICCLFVPGDRHVIIGTKSGKLQLFDINAGNLLESVDAHDGCIWGLSLSADKNSFVSGSADHEVKFWDFELVQDKNYSTTAKRLSMTHTQTLKMAEEILAIKYSSNGQLLAVSLLDSTIKVFMADSLKFFLSLYGHKFPVLCLDISMDSCLIITGSADKNIKIWGLEFGDCHKSIFAHDDTITAVQFVAKTHYFFSASKDNTIKYWDADKFQNIMTLNGHHGEILAMSVSSGGEYVVTASHNKSLRLWQRTEELLVIEEEREMEREEADEMSMIERNEKPIPGENDDEVGKAGKKTLETVKAAERIMEAIELFKEETEKQKDEGDTYEPHPILKATGMTPTRYVLDVLVKVKSSELEESLLVFPFSYVIDLLELIKEWLQRSWQVERVVRCSTFLLKIHHNEITSSPVLLSTVDSLKQHTQQSVKLLKDQVGFNLAGLRFLRQQLELRNVSFFDDAKENFNKKAKTKKIVAFA